MFYRTASEEYPIHVILGDATYCKIRTEHVYKGQPEDPIVEGTHLVGLFMVVKNTQTANACT